MGKVIWMSHLMTQEEALQLDSMIYMLEKWIKFGRNIRYACGKNMFFQCVLMRCCFLEVCSAPFLENQDESDPWAEFDMPTSGKAHGKA